MKREITISKTIEIDLNDLPDWLLDEIFRYQLHLTFHDSGRIHINGLTSDGFAEFDLISEIKEQVADLISFRSDAQKQESIEDILDLEKTFQSALEIIVGAKKQILTA